jgi:hypothetical protein
VEGKYAEVGKHEKMPLPAKMGRRLDEQIGQNAQIIYAKSAKLNFA